MSSEQKWLEKMSEAIRTQDNRMTAHPIFNVQQEVLILGVDPHCHCEVEHCFVDEMGEIQHVLAGEEIPSHLSRVPYIRRWQHITSFFTVGGAEDFMRDHAHHYGAMRVYVDSLYRNPEMRRVREFLMSQGGGA